MLNYLNRYSNFLLLMFKRSKISKQTASELINGNNFFKILWFWGTNNKRYRKKKKMFFSFKIKEKNNWFGWVWY
ncbi:MAG: hypothetical protein CM15mP29_1710 [Alphaproteobacteria bacterium]|nr:MAG: hypothetical protein CM15mP29_1710 [Alphaproteobacteria bacterium]